MVTDTIRCLQCNSDRVQRLQVIFEGGTQHTRSSGMAHGPGGAHAISQSSTSQTRAAQKATPPAKKKLGGPVMMAITGLLILAFTRGPGLSLGALLGFLLLAGGGYLTYAHLSYNIGVRPRLYQDWMNSWYCNQCGAISRT